MCNIWWPGFVAVALKLTAKCNEMLIERKCSVTFCVVPHFSVPHKREKRSSSYDILVNLNQFGQELFIQCHDLKYILVLFDSVSSMTKNYLTL